MSMSFENGASYSINLGDWPIVSRSKSHVRSTSQQPCLFGAPAGKGAEAPGARLELQATQGV